MVGAGGFWPPPSNKNKLAYFDVFLRPPTFQNINSHVIIRSVILAPTYSLFWLQKVHIGRGLTKFGVVQKWGPGVSGPNKIKLAYFDVFPPIFS